MEWFTSLRSQLWQWVDRSVTLFGALPPNRTQAMTLTHSDASELAQLLEGTTAGVLILEILRGVFRISWSAAASGQELARITLDSCAHLLELCPNDQSPNIILN